MCGRSTGIALDEARPPATSRIVQEAELAPSWAARVARDGKVERNGSNGGGSVYNRCGQEARREILDRSS